MNVINCKWMDSHLALGMEKSNEDGISVTYIVEQII